ncbi:retrovirus-related pol polyprotein from transposon TNT 1-94 [Tanacetum coccineum]
MGVLYTQQAGIDYNEVFSPVVRHTSIGVILSLTTCEDYELEQLDVKMTFLHGNLEETIYMRQPPGFEKRMGNKGLAATAMIVVFTLRSLHQSKIEYTKGLLRKEFDMKELGPARKILGMEIVSDRVGLCAIGSTLRPDITYVVSIVSRYLANLGLVYGRDQGKHVNVDDFVDADYAKDPDMGRSIIGYVFMVHGCVVSWKATLQHVIALSTTEAGYMVLTEAVKESIWLKGILIELEVNLREMVESKEIEVAKIGTKDNAADAFTKVVPSPKFTYCMEILGVRIN